MTSRRASVALAALLTAAAAPPWTEAEGPGPAPVGGLEEPLSPLETAHLEAAARRLRHHVARIVSTLPPPRGGHLSPQTVDGWGIVVGRREIRAQVFLVKDARTIRAVGPEGEVALEIVARDVERRVARLRAAAPLPAVGLHPASPCPPEARAEDMDLFALVSTRPGAGVVTGALTALGEAPHLEGNLRSTLELARGMPVFDARLRWVGLARAVAWDEDRAMLIPPELTRTPTRAAPPPEPPPDEESERPWWAK
jgi:hypothetical protein